MKEIRLTQGQVALVDDGDYQELSKYRWYAAWNPHTHSYRAVRTDCTGDKPKTVYMARVIMQAHPGQKVDHRRHDTLNNQRENLRLCTNAENGYNRKSNVGSSSAFKGVVWHRRDRKWQAYIRLANHLHHLGYFADEIAAARAYDVKAVEIFGDFALTNFDMIELQ